jgi:hypothetical protein
MGCDAKRVSDTDYQNRAWSQLTWARANAIRELLAGKIDAAQAAIGFTSMINSANNKKNAEGGLWRLWGLLANVAGHFEEEEWQNKACNSDGIKLGRC